MRVSYDKVFRSIASCLSVLFFFVTTQSSPAIAQPPVSTVFAVVVKRIETKSAGVNQEFALRTINDVVVDGVVVIPSGAKILGHVVEATIKGKDSSQSTLAIVIDKAVLENGRSISLQAIIAAIAAPHDSSLTSDPTYGMMHSNEPKMIGSGASGASRAGDLPASSKADSSAALGTARINGEMRKGLLLNSDSQGAIGFSGLSLSWRLTDPPAVTVFSNKSKEIKFDAGTQVLLRMAQPTVPG
jgi:hypothetical protein